MTPLRWQWLLLGVVLAYVAVGFFPLTAVEGDDIAISAGALQLSLHGNLDHGFDYRYDPQAATYWLVAGLHRFLGVPPLVGFGLLTLAGFAAFFGLGTWLVAHQTKMPAPLAGLALLLFQETYVSAYYANSSMIAAGFFFGSLFLAVRGRNVAAGALFSLAILARFDAVLMAPVFLVILFGKDRASLSRLLIFSISTTIALVLLGFLGGVSIARIWQEGSGHVERFASRKQTLMNYLTLVSGVGCLLWVLGLRAAIQERAWRVVLISLAGCVPLIAVYGMTVTTPKYLLYGLPFFTLLVVRGLKWLLASNSRPAVRLRWACVALLVLQYVAGPLTLISWALGRNVVVVGTHDGLRRLDSIGYAPVMWLRTKLDYWQAMEQAGRILRARCQTEQRGLVLTDDWFSSRWTAYRLLGAGYRCVDSARHFDHIPIASLRDFHVYAQGDKRMSTFEVDWLREGAASRDWRGRVGLASYDSALLLSGQVERGKRDSVEELADLEKLLGCPLAVEPWPGLFGPDRLWAFRVHPARADSSRLLKPEKGS